MIKHTVLISFFLAQSGRAIVKHANALLPFSKATSVLDIGCGYGVIVGALLSAHREDIPREARIIAGDSSPGIIELLRNRRSEDPAWERVEPTVLDALDLSPIPDGSLSHTSYLTLRSSSCQTIDRVCPRCRGSCNPAASLHSLLRPRSRGSRCWRRYTKSDSDKKLPEPASMWKTEVGNRVLEESGFQDIHTYSFLSTCPTMTSTVSLVRFSPSCLSRRCSCA